MGGIDTLLEITKIVEKTVLSRTGHAPHVDSLMKIRRFSNRPCVRVIALTVLLFQSFRNIYVIVSVLTHQLIQFGDLKELLDLERFKGVFVLATTVYPSLEVSRVR